MTFNPFGPPAFPRTVLTDGPLNPLDRIGMNHSGLAHTVNPDPCAPTRWFQSDPGRPGTFFEISAGHALQRNLRDNFGIRPEPFVPAPIRLEPIRPFRTEPDWPFETSAKSRRNRKCPHGLGPACVLCEG